MQILNRIVIRRLFILLNLFVCIRQQDPSNSNKHNYSTQKTDRNIKTINHKSTLMINLYFTFKNYSLSYNLISLMKSVILLLEEKLKIYF